MGKNKRNRNRPAGRSVAVPPMPTAHAGSTLWRRYRWLGLGLVAALVLAAIAYGWWTNSRSTVSTAVAPPAISPAKADFVGAGACAGCHSGEFAAWQNSQHAKAMQHATVDTVRGDFNNARFTYDGIV